MKLILLIAGAFSIALLSCGQDIPASKVPSVVINTIQLKFPNSGTIDWEKKQGRYEAEFSVDSTEHTVVVHETGDILWYKTDILQTSLPSLITSVISREQQGYTIDEIERINKGDTVYYRVELEAKGKKDKEIVYTPTGTVIENTQLIKILHAK